MSLQFPASESSCTQSRYGTCMLRPTHLNWHLSMCIHSVSLLWGTTKPWLLSGSILILLSDPAPVSVILTSCHVVSNLDVCGPKASVDRSRSWLDTVPDSPSTEWSTVQLLKLLLWLFGIFDPELCISGSILSKLCSANLASFVSIGKCWPSFLPNPDHVQIYNEKMKCIKLVGLS